MKNSVTKTENCTIINGLVLTEQAIDRLREFQDRDNDCIDGIQRSLANAVCLISANLDYFKDSIYFKKAKDSITDLAIFREWFDDLKKP